MEKKRRVDSSLNGEKENGSPSSSSLSSSLSPSSLSHTLSLTPLRSPPLSSSFSPPKERDAFEERGCKGKGPLSQQPSRDPPDTQCKKNPPENLVLESETPVKKSPPKGKVYLMTNAALQQLKKNPAYKNIDVVREAFKFNEWCDANGRAKSVRRFVNWLNRT